MHKRFATEILNLKNNRVFFHKNKSWDISETSGENFYVKFPLFNSLASYIKSLDVTSVEKYVRVKEMLQTIIKRRNMGKNKRRLTYANYYQKQSPTDVLQNGVLKSFAKP